MACRTGGKTRPEAVGGGQRQRLALAPVAPFEEFPQFMEGVERAEQLDDRHLRWHVDIAGVDREFEAEITDQQPDQRIAWRSRTGVDQGGVVTFHPLNETRPA